MSFIIRAGHIINGQIAAYIIHFEKVCMILDGKSFFITCLTWKATTY